MPALDRPTLKDFVKRALGFPKVEIELDDAQIYDSMDAAVEIFSQHYPIRRSLVKNIASTTVTLTAAEAGIGVYDVRLKSAAESPLGGVGLIDVSLGPVDYVGVYGTGLADVVIQQQYNKTADVVMGTDFDWEWDEESLTITVQPEAVGDVEIITLHEWDIAQIPLKFRSWIRRYTIAEARERQGLVRRKLGSVPGASTAMDLDGGDQVGEGREDKTELLEEIRNAFGDRVPPIKG
jgi:hypothetical protein